jgi:very-short-patch-repair endonuclease
MRASIYAELAALAEAGKISKGRDGRWRAVSAIRATPPSANPQHDQSHQGLLHAAPAVFFSLYQNGELPEPTDARDTPDPAALLRYYRSALRSDPRGAISQAEDRHGVQFQLISGSGPLTGEDGQGIQVKIGLNDLADEFRKALLKREANEQTMAIGWPIAVSQTKGTPVIWPIGLISADWVRTDTHLELTVDADDVLVNPDWLKGAARREGWKEKDLREVFNQPEGTGLPLDEFLTRLKEAVAGSLRGKVSGRSLATELDPARAGVYNIAGLFLPTDSTFTAGAVRDLDRIASWSHEELARTALAQVLGLESRVEPTPATTINTGPLNREQIAAVEQALNSSLTVVTGPPGTGKSQAIVSMVASILNAEGSVLVASKNHQALDAVEERLRGIASDVPFIVRTLDPARDLDVSFNAVLMELVREPSRSGPAPDIIARSRLATTAGLRADALRTLEEIDRLKCEIAEIIERLAARRGPELNAPTKSATTERASVLTRFLSVLTALLGKKRAAIEDANLAVQGASDEALRKHLALLQAECDRLGSPEDPVSLTTEIAELVQSIMPRALLQRTMLTETDRLRLGEEQANLELAQSSGPLRSDLAEKVVAHRPLWLASVLGAPKRIPLAAGLFDLVIFDEASQCDVASALPLFARAKRAVVVGDNKQLSFISQLGIAHDRNLMQAQSLPIGKMGRYAQSRQSLFDLANLTPGAAKVMLRDQYRSATDIVEYINEAFYGGRLRVAGNQEKLKAPAGMKPGIAWQDVPSPATPMATNVNMAEVFAMTEHLKLLLLTESYSGTVGIIAPFRPQVQALSDAIHSAIPEKVLAKVELRVGTVDSFQGQERDLILFSPCLGPSSAMSAVSFVQKDWRRLNVAISRARAVAHVFGDLGYARSGKVSSLQKLARVATEPRKRAAESTFDSEWERRIFYALKAKGLEPLPQFEIAGRRLDFALFGRGEIKLDLEIDGRHWHADTDGKRKLADHWRDKQLQSIGWRVQRFWVDELERDLEGCIERVKQQLS